VGLHGFVIHVEEVSDIGAGMVDNSTGSAAYKVAYRAIVFRPFAQEIVDCTVLSCNPYGFSCGIGNMLNVFIHRKNMPQDVQEFTAEGSWVSEDRYVICV
jgi:DNA-directed RNA polymerase II subunit RPB7